MTFTRQITDVIVINNKALDCVMYKWWSRCYSRMISPLSHAGGLITVRLLTNALSIACFIIWDKRWIENTSQVKDLISVMATEHSLAVSNQWKSNAGTMGPTILPHAFSSRLRALLLLLRKYRCTNSIILGSTTLVLVDGDDSQTRKHHGVRNACSMRNAPTRSLGTFAFDECLPQRSQGDCTIIHFKFINLVWKRTCYRFSTVTSS